MLYADDIVLLTETAEVLLNALNEWCSYNDMHINASKSNVLHFRPKSVPCSHFEFRCRTDYIKSQAWQQIPKLVFEYLITKYLNIRIFETFCACFVNKEFINALCAKLSYCCLILFKGTESHMRKKRKKKKIVKNCFYLDVFACKALRFAD